MIMQKHILNSELSSRCNFYKNKQPKDLIGPEQPYSQADTCI